jgi:hypothetical protein
MGLFLGAAAFVAVALKAASLMAPALEPRMPRFLLLSKAFRNLMHFIEVIVEAISPNPKPARAALAWRRD